MQNPEISSLTTLKSKWKSHLVRAGYLTSSEVFLASSATLIRRTRLSWNEVNELLVDLAVAVQEPARTSTRTLSEILGLQQDVLPDDEEKREEDDEENELLDTITFGDAGIDTLLGNGIRRGTITEIAGESGSGKSHLCLQLALTVQLSRELGGVEGGTILISSEGIIASPRLFSLAKALIARTAISPSSSNLRAEAVSPTNHGRPAGGIARTERDYLNNIHVIKAENVEALDTILSHQVPAAIYHYASSSTMASPSILPIKLILLDSIAAPFRAATKAGSSGLIQRSIEIGRIGDALKRLATLYSCAVVVVNQATDVFHLPPLSFPVSLPPPPPSPAAQLDMPPPLALSASLVPHLGRSNSSNSNGAFLPATSRPDSPRAFKFAHELHRLPTLLYNRFQAPSFSGQSRSLGSMAALGYSWACAVNTRIMVSRTGRRRRRGERDGLGEGEGEQEGGEDVLVRRMTLVFSPFSERGSVDYVIESEGVRSV